MFSEIYVIIKQMKKIFTYHFDWSLLAITFFSLVVSFFVFVNITKANFPGGGLDQTWMEINGWAWSPNIGWLSLNCLNDFSGDGDLNDPIDNTCLSGGGIDYGLKIDKSADGTTRAVGGCAWAGNVLWWICFDDPLLAGNTLAPDYGVYLNGPSSVQYYNGSEPDFTGWPDNNEVENSLCHNEDVDCHASILALEGVPGWSHELGFPIGGSSSGALEGCFNCTETKTCSHDNGVSCTQNSDCEALQGGSVCNTARTCDNCLEYTYDLVDPDILDSVIAGYQCTSCTFTSGIDTLCTENAYERNHNTCSSCANYYSFPGLITDYSTSTNAGFGSMCGWAYNEDSFTHNGVGWLQFGPRITAGNNPYFQVNSGDIYARGAIRNYFPPVSNNTYNAFVIETNSNTIYQLYASSSLNLINRPLISFPSESLTTGKYTNVLGSLDVRGLITELASSGKNKYGSSIDDNTNSATWLNLKNGGGPAILLNNTVYSSAAVTLAQSGEIIFKDGTGAENGSGVIFIDGDLNINHDIKYDSTDPDKLKNIASPVFIIDGDLAIDASVTEIAGTFIVLGSFKTGLGASQLKVNGSVLAQSFALERTYSLGPSELFINDGRLKVNPPAGLQNFSANLPKFTYQ